MVGQWLSMIGMMAVFAITVALAYYVTRFISKQSTAMSQGKHLEVVERLSLGLDKQLLLVRVGRSYVLLSVSAKMMSVVGQFTAEEMVLADCDTEQFREHIQISGSEDKKAGFGALLQKLMNPS